MRYIAHIVHIIMIHSIVVAVRINYNFTSINFPLPPSPYLSRRRHSFAMFLLLFVPSFHLCQRVTIFSSPPTSLPLVSHLHCVKILARRTSSRNIHLYFVRDAPDTSTQYLYLTVPVLCGDEEKNIEKKSHLDSWKWKAMLRSHLNRIQR